MTEEQAEQKEKYCAAPGKFCWNELATTDVAGAKKFYGSLLGWKTKEFSKDYTQFTIGEDMAGGLLQCQKPGVPAHWVPYVMVEDVDATAKNATKLGGSVLVEAFDVPTVGRIAVLRDPQGAVIGVFKPERV